MDEKYLYDIFEIYYNNAMDAKKKGNNRIAKTNLLKAAETLLKLAKTAEGDLKKARFDRANRLMEIANTLEVGDNQPTSRNHTNHSGKQSNTKDDTTTNFKAAEIPDISFDDVAGLDAVKDAVYKRVILPLKRPDLYEAFKKKSGGGILMYGLPGTGKTMIAKAIAHETNAAFYEIKCSDIMSKWVGESEQNVKNLFETARKNKVALIFFDEFEAIASKRGDDNNPVMDRLVPELLAQIQGFSTSDNTLLLIAATNRPWDIDSAMLRPGRFNELIHVTLPDDEAREFIIRKSLKGLPVENDLDYHHIVDITRGGNCADVDEFCERLKNLAIERSLKMNEGISKINNSDIDETYKDFKFSVFAEDIDKLVQFEKDNRKGE